MYIIPLAAVLKRQAWYDMFWAKKAQRVEATERTEPTMENAEKLVNIEPQYRLYSVASGDTLRVHEDAALLATWAHRALDEPWGLIREDFEAQQGQAS
jgi:hypothetical protein